MSQWLAFAHDDLRGMCHALHEADTTKFAGVAGGRIRDRFGHESLKRIRAAYGCTQSELAKRSGASLRSIQTYERRNKDINRAGAESLCRISMVLGCMIEDLLET